jgi:hypothetical protein
MLVLAMQFSKGDQAAPAEPALASKRDEALVRVTRARATGRSFKAE